MTKKELEIYLQRVLTREDALSEDLAVTSSTRVRIHRCEATCPECEIGAHERCADKHVCACTHPIWGDYTGTGDLDSFSLASTHWQK
jgi:hypothetical protein